MEEDQHVDAEKATKKASNPGQEVQDYLFTILLPLSILLLLWLRLGFS